MTTIDAADWVAEASALLVPHGYGPVDDCTVGKQVAPGVSARVEFRADGRLDPPAPTGQGPYGQEQRFAIGRVDEPPYLVAVLRIHHARIHEKIAQFLGTSPVHLPDWSARAGLAQVAGLARTRWSQPLYSRSIPEDIERAYVAYGAHWIEHQSTLRGLRRSTVFSAARGAEYVAPVACALDSAMDEAADSISYVLHSLRDRESPGPREYLRFATALSDEYRLGLDVGGIGA